MADDDKPLPIYTCAQCYRQLGWIENDGAFRTFGPPILRTVHADLICVCGNVVYWRRSDVKLKRLVERMLAPRQGGY